MRTKVSQTETENILLKSIGKNGKAVFPHQNKLLKKIGYAGNGNRWSRKMLKTALDSLVSKDLITYTAEPPFDAEWVSRKGRRIEIIKTKYPPIENQVFEQGPIFKQNYIDSIDITPPDEIIKNGLRLIAKGLKEKLRKEHIQEIENLKKEYEKKLSEQQLEIQKNGGFLNKILNI